MTIHHGIDAQRDAERLLEEAPCFSVLPAGCGKTELLARCSKAAAADQGTRILILTHTNAGVDVLRRRVRKVGVRRTSVSITTIAGWCESLCRRYPILAGVEIDPSAQGRDYAAIYSGAVNVLGSPAIQRMVQASWGVALVDEYQDCNRAQHDLVARLSSLVRTIVVGDDLQAIFNFEGEPVDWDRQVAATWPQVDLATVPHRWTATNPLLGQHLDQIRNLLIARQPIDLGNYSSIRWTRQSHAVVVARAKAAGARSGTCLVIVRHPPQTVALARKCGGMFGSLEALDTGDLIGFAEIADSSDGPGPVLSALVALADKAIARLPPGFKTRSAKIVAGEAVTYRAGSALSAYTAAAIDFMRTQSNEALAETIAAIAAFPKIVIARQELWGDLEIMVGAALHQSQSHTDAATQTRERARRRGRRPASHVIGTTLLAKGLEYDNVVVTNAGTMDRENLYVALTRATTTLEVLSETRVLSPQES